MILILSCLLIVSVFIDSYLLNEDAYFSCEDLILLESSTISFASPSDEIDSNLVFSFLIDVIMF